MEGKIICIEMQQVIRSSLREEIWSDRTRQRISRLISMWTADKTSASEALSATSRSLPYRKPVLALIQSAQSRGIPVYLTSKGSELERVIANHLKCPIGDPEQLSREFGSQRIIDNLQVLEGAGAGADSRSTVRSARALVKALRPHQWSKNLLIFVPLFAAHQVLGEGKLLQCAQAFVAFCFLASSAYLINDAVDVPADRHHKSKKNRPIAAGDLGLIAAVLVALGLLGGGIFLAATLNQLFLWAALIYLVSTLFYSFFLKRVAILDTLTLAGLYTLRILAGHAATGVKLSFWLLSFSGFLFLSLALVKRYTELLDMGQAAGKSVLRGRGYAAEDKIQVLALGVSSGQISVLILMFYLNSKEVIELYHTPYLIYGVCPILLFWICRIWLLAGRGEVNQDPIVFALKDRVSYLLGALVAVIAFLAI